MPDGNATYQQSNFLGGEIAKAAQGRSDDPRYKSGLSIMRNAQPTEQGAFKRRSGTQTIIPTRNRNYAKLLTLETSSSLPYVMEFTDLSLRFVFGTYPCFTNDDLWVTTVSAGGGQIDLTLSANHGWSVGDDVMVFFPEGYPIANEGGYRGRVMQVMSVPTSSRILLGNEAGNATLTGTIVTDGTPRVFRIRKLTTTISGSDVLRTLRAIPTDSSAIIVQNTVAPQQVTIATAASGDQDPVFALAAAAFVDGPYDTLKNETGTVSGFTGSITFTPATSTFSASDVGRHIRLFSEPPAWASGTTYAYGDLVKYNNGYWRSTAASNTGNFPGAPKTVSSVLTTFWSPAPDAPRWAWGIITSQSGSACVLTLTDASATGGATGTIPSGNGSTITAWQLGLFRAANYPTNGVFHEGRLYLGGVVGNRFDASMSGSILQFSLTDQYGNVNDNNAISYVLASSDNLYWMRSDDRGVVAGALKGEWLISASTGEDGITPTNVKARRVTKYQCAFIEPVEAGSTIVFAQRYRRHIYEYLVENISGRFSGKPINDMALPFAEPGAEELAYTAEPTPVVWARMADGSLAGCTYRRLSRFVSENPLFDGWHGHSIGDDRFVEALCSSANPGGGDAACNILNVSGLAPTDPAATGDNLYLVTNSNLESYDRLIEVLRPLSGETDDFSAGWYVDEAPGRGKHLVSATATFDTVVCSAIGGIAGQDGFGGGTEPADIGHRSTATGTVPAIGNEPARQNFLNLACLAAVEFKGYTWLYDLPRPTRVADKFTISTWFYNNTAYNGRMPQGMIYGAPFVYYNSATLTAKLPDGPLLIEAYDIAATATATRKVKLTLTQDMLNSDGTVAYHASSYPATAYCQVRPRVKYKTATSTVTSYRGVIFTGQFIDGNLTLPYSFGDTSSVDNPGGSSASPISNAPAGWYNLLYSYSKGVKEVCYLNDTLVFSGLSSFSLHFDDLSGWHIGGSMGNMLRDLGVPAAATSYNWVSSKQDNRPADGNGLMGAVTELWIAPSQYIDFDVQANRRLFNCTDVANQTYVPADLGARGQTPTGTKPLVYLTGSPTEFFKNRARKNAPLAVENLAPDIQHELAHIFGNDQLDLWTSPLPGQL